MREPRSDKSVECTKSPLISFEPGKKFEILILLPVKYCCLVCVYDSLLPGPGKTIRPVQFKNIRSQEKKQAATQSQDRT